MKLTEKQAIALGRGTVLRGRVTCRVQTAPVLAVMRRPDRGQDY
jgi:hypothetical protein